MLRFHYENLASTSDTAARLAGLNPQGPLLVTARSQTAGRGRTGRRWWSPVGGAWFTLAYPTTASPMVMEAAPIVAGLALRNVLLEQAALPPERVAIKWPNDVLLDGEKVAGILCERNLGGADMGAGRYLMLVGVGINANVYPTGASADLRFPATSLLQATGRRSDPRQLAERSAHAIRGELDRLAASGFTDELAAAANRCVAWKGRRVGLRLSEDTIQGTMRGVDGRGRLVLDIDGVRLGFNAGEVSRVRVVPAEATPALHPNGSARSLQVAAT